MAEALIMIEHKNQQLLLHAILHYFHRFLLKMPFNIFKLKKFPIVFIKDFFALNSNVSFIFFVDSSCVFSMLHFQLLQVPPELIGPTTVGKRSPRTEIFLIKFILIITVCQRLAWTPY